MKPMPIDRATVLELFKYATGSEAPFHVSPVEMISILEDHAKHPFTPVDMISECHALCCMIRIDLRW